MPAWCLLAVALCVCLHSCRASTLLFADSPSTAYLKPAAQGAALSPAGLTASVLSLLAAEPLGSVDSGVSKEVGSLVGSDLFKRPQAILSLHVAGLDKGEDLSRFGAQLPAHQIAFSAERQPANQLLAALGTAAAVREAGFAHHSLDYTSLPGCSDACMEEALREALAQYGANYSVQGPPMTGLVEVRLASSKTVTLDLSSIPERLLAVELAALHRTVQDVVEEKARREAQNQAADTERRLLDCTLLGMQAIQAQYGAQSPQVEAAGQLLVTAMGDAEAALRKAFNDRVVVHIALLGDVPVSSSGLKGLLAWRETYRRRSLLASVEQSGNATDTNRFTTSATAWISGLILVFFLGTGCYCLTHMQFKQDSLLYPRTKTD